jgi:hypothetical protein
MSVQTDALQTTSPAGVERNNGQGLKVFRVVAAGQIDSDESAFHYWMSRPAGERLAAVEEIRREYHAWRGTDEPGLERVARIVAVA